MTSLMMDEVGGGRYVGVSRDGSEAYNSSEGGENYNCSSSQFYTPSAPFYSVHCTYSCTRFGPQDFCDILTTRTLRWCLSSSLFFLASLSRSPYSRSTLSATSASLHSPPSACEPLRGSWAGDMARRA